MTVEQIIELLIKMLKENIIPLLIAGGLIAITIYNIKIYVSRKKITNSYNSSKTINISITHNNYFNMTKDRVGSTGSENIPIAGENKEM